MLIHRQQLCELIPHEGDMCLLDSVESWDDNQITCNSLTHQKQSNPLRDAKRLGCVNAIEYGAQAVAVHGGLLARQNNNNSPRSGFLVQVKEIDFVDCDLSSLPESLTIQAQRIHFDDTSMLYSITIKHHLDELMQGRIMIFTNV